MKKFLIFLGAVAFVCVLHLATANGAAFPPALGGTGTTQVPASGTVPIGNGAGTYTPATLVCVGGCTVTNGSGSITITAASSSAILTNTGNWAGTWQLRSPSDFLASSTTYVSSVNGQSGAVTITFPATTTINGTQASTFYIVGDNIGTTSTVSGATTTIKLINTGNWSGTWNGLPTSTFYLASNPNGYISSLTGALLIANNLSDLASTSTARTNIGYSGAATQITISPTGTISFATTSISQFANDKGYLTAAPATSTIAAGGGTATGPSFTFSTSTKGSSWNVTSSGATVTFTLPMNISFFTNDAGYGSSTSGGSATTTFSVGGVTVNGPAFTLVTSTQSGIYNATTSGATIRIIIPSNVGFFTNDSGYITTSTNNFGGLTNSSISAVAPITWSAANGIGFNTSTPLFLSGLYTMLGGITANSTATLNSSTVIKGSVSSTELSALISAGANGVWGAYGGSNCAGGQFSTGLSASGTVPCSTPAGSGNVSSATTTVNNNFPFWSGSNQLSATSTLTINGTTVNNSGTITSNGVAVLTAAPATSTLTAQGGTATGPAIILATSGPMLAITCSVSTCTWTITTSSLNLGTAASQANSFFLQSANNLSDLASTSSARTNIGYTAGNKLIISATGTISVATTSVSQWANDSGYITSLSGALLVANNLSDLNSTSSARSNIGFTGGNKITISATGTIGLSSNNISQFLNDAGYGSSTSGGSATTTITADGATSTGPTFNFVTSTKSGVWDVSSSANGTIRFTIPPANDAYFAPTTTIATKLSQLTNDPGYSSSTGANPTNSTVGMNTANGSASTFMRSDAQLGLATTSAFTLTGAWTHNATDTFNSSTILAGTVSSTEVSSLILANANGIWGAYGGASSCGAGNAVTTISAVGGTTCAAFGSSNVSTSTANTWSALQTFTGGLTVNSTSTFNSSTIFNAYATSTIGMTLQGPVLLSSSTSQSCLGTDSTGKIGTGTCGSAPSSTIATTTATIGVSFDGGGSVIAANASSAPFQVPYNGTIRRWWLSADLACSISFDVWKANKAIPTIANRIAGTDNPSSTSLQFQSSTALTGWTTSISAGDMFMVVASGTPSGCTKATVGIDYSKT